MAELYEELKPKSKYYDRSNYASLAEYEEKLQDTTTVYVGNLSFFTSQDSIFSLFSRCGKVKDIKMGINDEGHPCGFCFVIFQTHEQARLAVEYISHTRLCERVIRVDWDPGYKEGREKGRGSGGQQKRDEFRNQEDVDRPIKAPPISKRPHYDYNNRSAGPYRGGGERNYNTNRYNNGNNSNYQRDYNNGQRDYSSGGNRYRGGYNNGQGYSSRGGYDRKNEQYGQSSKSTAQEPTNETKEEEPRGEEEEDAKKE